MLWWFAETALVAGLLAAFAALAGRSRRFGPEARHAFWLVVLVRLVLPPVVSWPWSLPDPWAPSMAAVAAEIPRGDRIEGPAGPVSPGSDLEGEILASLEAKRPAPSPIPESPSVPPGSEIGNLQSALPRLLLAAWLAGSAAVVGSRLARVARFRRSLAGARPAPGWLAGEARAVGERLGVRPPPILIVPGGRTPLLWCLGRPRLIVPSALVDRLAADRWPGILAHELAHLGRRDHWVARLELLAEAIWWWNPLFWHVRRRLHEEAELACDARVVRALPGRRFAYAEALIEVCEHLSRSRSRADAIPSPALGVVGPGASRSLEGRLTMILGEPAPHRPRRLAALAVATLAVLSVPGWTVGQQPPDPPRADASPKPADEPEPPKAAAPADDSDPFLLDPRDGAAISGLDPEALRAVTADPEVVAAAKALRRARSDLDDVIRRSKSAAEPDEQAARKRLDDASRQYTRAWSAKVRETRERAEARPAADPAQGLDPDPQVRHEIEADPELASLREKRNKAWDRVQSVGRTVRDPGDPALRKANQDFSSIHAQFRKLLDDKLRAADVGAALLKARRDGKAAELQRAEAQRRLARSVVKRHEILLKKSPNLVSREEVEKGEAEAAVADAEVAARKAALDEAEALLKRAGPATEPTAGPTPAEPEPKAERLRALREAKAAAVSKAEGDLARAKEVVARNTRLVAAGKDMITRREVEKGEAELDIASAGLEGARAELALAEMLLGRSGSTASGGAEMLEARLIAARAGQKAAEARARLAVSERDRSVQLRDRGAIEPAEVDRAEGDARAALAELDRERAEVAAAQDRLAVASRGTAPAAAKEPARVAPPSGALTDAREAVELIEVQLQGRRAELVGAEAAKKVAALESRRLNENHEAKGLPSIEQIQAAELRFLSADAEVARKGADVREYEVRLKQATRRAEAEEAAVRSDLERARDRLKWSEDMQKKGYVSKATATADRLQYDNLMRQLDPDYRPSPPEAAGPEKP